MTGGYVRFAAYLCKEWATLDTPEVLEATRERIIGKVAAQLNVISPFDKVALALSLFAKVGLAGQVAHEWEAICRICRLGDSQDAFASLRILKDRIGLVTIGSRYAYVTPQIVADAFFAKAWDRWGISDPVRFYEQLPQNLQRQFILQACRSSQRIRHSIAQAFYESFDRLTVQEFALGRVAMSICQLVELEPERFFARLHRLIVGTDRESLAKFTASDYEGGGCSAKNELVGLCEKLGAFVEYFNKAETLLFYLASHECEEGKSERATTSWVAMYDPMLSGTTVPLMDRLAIVKKRLDSVESPQVASLLLSGLFQCIEGNHARMGRPAMTAGRMVPTEWVPRTWDERCEPIRLALRVAMKLAMRVDRIGETTRSALAARLPACLHYILLPTVSEVVRTVPFQDAERNLLLQKLDDELERALRQPESNDWAEWRQQVLEIRSMLVPSELEARVRAFISRDPWHSSLRKNGEEEASDAIRALADEICRLEAIPTPLLAWLFGTEAQAAVLFGSLIAEYDHGQKLLPSICDQVLVSDRAGFLRGYLFHLRERAPEVLLTQRGLLDLLAVRQPIETFQICAWIGDPLDGFIRCINLVAQRKVSPGMLRLLYSWIGNRKMSVDERIVVAETLAKCAERDDDAWRALLEYIGPQFYGTSDEVRGELFAESRWRECAWFLIENASSQRTVNNENYFIRIADWLASIDCSRVAQNIEKVLAGCRWSFGNEALVLVRKIAESQPDAMMEAIGNAIDAEDVFRVRPGQLRNVMALMSPVVVESWLKKHGRTGAVKIAPHLRGPFLGADQCPSLDSIVLHILEEYGEDDQVMGGYSLGLQMSEIWSGNPSKIYRQKAEMASAFQSHALSGVRRWASSEVERCERLASWYDSRAAEEGLDE